MRFTKLALLLTLTILSLCFSCKKDYLAGGFLLTDEMKAQNPYQGGETLKFVSGSGNVYVWSVNDRSNQVHKMLKGINTKEYYLVEIDHTSLGLVDSSFYFSFGLEMGGLGDQNTDYDIWLHYGDVVSGFSFNLPLSTETTPYIDSLFVMNTWVKDVFVYENEMIDNRAYRLYYSTEYGIVKIDFSDGSNWEIEKIEW